MQRRLFALSVILLMANTGLAQSPKYPTAKVSFEDFKGLMAEVESHRASRLVDLDTFMKMSKEPGVIILDTRSADRYERIHVKGAAHLAFTDFTQDDLAKVIPTFETTILIYCNNNFEGGHIDLPTKARTRISFVGLDGQVVIEGKPITMALNIPTYLNLYGYGYRNVYELHELVNLKDPRIAFAGSALDQKSTRTLAPHEAYDPWRVFEFRAQMTPLFPLAQGHPVGWK